MMKKFLMFRHHRSSAKSSTRKDHPLTETRECIYSVTKSIQMMGQPKTRIRPGRWTKCSFISPQMNKLSLETIRLKRSRKANCLRSARMLPDNYSRSMKCSRWAAKLIMYRLLYVSKSSKILLSWECIVWVEKCRARTSTSMQTNLLTRKAFKSRERGASTR